MDKVRIHYFLEKTKKRKVEKDTEKEGDESDGNIQEQEKKRLMTLMKKQKLRAVRQLVNRQIESQPWGQDAKAKVCTTFVINAARLRLLKSKCPIYFLNFRLEAVSLN